MVIISVTGSVTTSAYFPRWDPLEYIGRSVTLVSMFPFVVKILPVPKKSVLQKAWSVLSGLELTAPTNFTTEED